MKYFMVICCVLASVASKDQKISLDDIENDNNKSPKLPAPPSNYGFLPVKTAADYARQQPKYVQYVPPQQYTPPQYYYPQQTSNLYQQYANVQYVTDNSIAQTQQQYYTPQYVYYQQYTAPSTAIQTVVDPKGGIQYVMYVPSYVPSPKAEQTQNVESVIYDQQSYVLPQQVTPSVKYVETETQQQPQQPVYTRHEPKSLLDSYVPSYLQVQYYKQQQAQANVIQQSLKDASRQIPGKSDGKSSYTPTQTHNSAETILNYTYQNPGSTQQKYH